MKLELFPPPYAKINSKCVNNLNIKATKISEENPGISLHDPGFNNVF